MIDLLTVQQQYAFLSYEFFGNTVMQYTTVVVVFLVVFSILKLFKRRVIKNLHTLAEKTAGDFDDLIAQIIQSVGKPFYLFVSLAFAKV